MAGQADIIVAVPNSQDLKHADDPSTHLRFKFNEQDAQAYIAGTPGAYRVEEQRGDVEAPNAAERAATFEAMTVPQLKTYAEEHNVDLSDASVKADIIAAIKAAEAQGN